LAGAASRDVIDGAAVRGADTHSAACGQCARTPKILRSSRLPTRVCTHAFTRAAELHNRFGVAAPRMSALTPRFGHRSNPHSSSGLAAPDRSNASASCDSVSRAKIHRQCAGASKGRTSGPWHRIASIDSNSRSNHSRGIPLCRLASPPALSLPCHASYCIRAGANYRRSYYSRIRAGPTDVYRPAHDPYTRALNRTSGEHRAGTAANAWGSAENADGLGAAETAWVSCDRPAVPAAAFTRQASSPPAHSPDACANAFLPDNFIGLVT
jgi:hypothetical protein